MRLDRQAHLGSPWPLAPVVEHKGVSNTKELSGLQWD